MKKFLSAVLALTLFLPSASLARRAEAAYTLDTIYGAYEPEHTPRPYFGPCSGFTPSAPEEIQLAERTIYFHLNENEAPVSLGARLMPLNSRRGEITYSSSDESVAVVDRNGAVASKNKLGSAVITASCGEITAKCVVSTIIGAEGVKIKGAPEHLYADRPVSAQLEAEITPADAGLKDVIWESSDTSIATVDRTGAVMPCGVGEVTITVTTKDRAFTDSCKINVSVLDMPVRAVFIENQIEAIPVGAEYKLNAYIYPESAVSGDILWSSSDNSVLSVDKNGKITAHKTGTVTVTAKTAGKKDSFRLNVINADAASFKYNVISNPIEERIAALESENITYSHYDTTLSEAVSIQERSGATVFTTDAYPAYKSDIEYYIVPSDLLNDAEKYQFLDLSGSNGISSDVLDAYLSGKGVLNGMGKVFTEAAKTYNVSEVYLAVHACLESGNGTSQLARGVDYNGEVVYNMFGIGAIDSAPLAGGAQYAYLNGWTSVEDAIMGGAEWISKYYINNSDYRQNTLYKMRWNPENPGVHQYATDVAWASKQAETLKNMFAAFPTAKITFDYPVYHGETEVKFGID